MQQAFKTMMSQMNSQNSPMSNPTLSSGSPFPIPPTFATGTTISPSVSEPAVSIDVTATKVEEEPVTNVKSRTENMEAKKFAFVDVSPEETDQKSPFKEDATDADVSKSAQPTQELPQNGAASKQAYNGSDGSQFSRKPGSVLSVEAVEKMMEDPTVQKMIYPYAAYTVYLLHNLVFPLTHPKLYLLYNGVPPRTGSRGVHNLLEI
uniref:Uncharacterized protein n=1 Tax=Cucumis sativus TaxID=3659 RepID=A0A0A0KR61_CUCSA